MAIPAPTARPTSGSAKRTRRERRLCSFVLCGPPGIRSLALVFNTGLETDQLGTLSPLVRAYRLTVTDADGREKIHEITDNIKRQVVHHISLETVARVHIRLLSNDNAPFYEMFAVKFYL